MDRIRSLQELETARNQALGRESALKEQTQFQLYISVGSCSIAAGANETLEAIRQYIAENQIHGVQTKVIGCIGLCALEPIVQVLEYDRQMVTYGKVTPAVVQRIFKEHLERHLIVQQYVVENI